ncbi:uncharacterized protein GIQ15_02679 [Arthroderma uncinatum]|uniref:uncharacterized protein n=1 Tax=Arthroderma uncinatum TaxID=74035 RepID=UPI00144AC91B|nr:uncharacterized protein GIQ15_02679 [Arthroderma uncinatum]KAF3483355.1 hypothetical protein GIQ15_02679 [Arthroderma uncinatum]
MDPINTHPPPETRNWRAECTHTSMTRVFDADGHIGCTRCGEAMLRWVYICTEDQNRTLSDEFIRDLAVPLTSGESTDTSSTATASTASTASTPVELSLNEWVSKAIEDGHYTDAEVETLRAQRADVLEAIRMESTRKEEELRQRWAAKLAFWKTPVFARPRPDPFLVEQGCKAFGLDRPEPHPAVIPPCKTSYCHYCRPSGCERSWQSLERLCRKNMEVRDRHGGKIKSIFDIPMTDIRRPLPRRPVRYNNNSNDDVSMTTSMESEAISDTDSRENIENVEERNENNEETHSSKEEQIIAASTSLQNSQHWSRVGLHESLSSARNDSLYMSKPTHDHPGGLSRLAKRPRLMLRPRFIAEQTGPSPGELSEHTNVLSTDAKTEEEKSEIETEKPDTND